MLGWIAETTLVAAVLAALALTLDWSRRWSSEARHAVWVVVLLKFLLPPVVAWPRPLLAPPPTPPEVLVAAVGTPPPAARLTAPVAAPPSPSGSGPSDRPATGPAPLATASSAPVPAVVQAPESETKPTAEFNWDVDPAARPTATTEPLVAASNETNPNPSPSGSPGGPTLDPGGAEPPPPPPTPTARSAPLTWAPRSSLLKGLGIWLRPNWPALILGLWAVGSLVVAGRTLIRVARFRRVLARGWAASEALGAEVAAVAERVGARVPGATVVVPGLAGPLVWCLGRPTLALPEGFAALPRATRRSLLAHELAHLARGDHWVARLELGAGLVWWWNPLFRLARARVRRLAEAACDARVIRAYPESRFAYAEALVVASASPGSPSPAAPPLPALGIGEAARTLEARLTMILRDPVPPPSRWLRPGVLALVALALPSWTLARQDPAPATAAPPAPASAVASAPTADARPTGEPAPAPTPPAAAAAPPASPGASAPPLLAAGVAAPPPVDPAQAAAWTTETIAAGVDERPQPTRSLAFRHTATYRLTSQNAFMVNNEPDYPGVHVQAADVALARPPKPPASPTDFRLLMPTLNQQYGYGSRLGNLFRIDALEADRGPTPLQSPAEVGEVRPEWVRWFAATDARAVTFGTTALVRGPVPVRWLAKALDTSPPATDDLTPHFYTKGRATFGDRSNPGTGPLRVRPEALIDVAGPMLLLFRPSQAALLPLLDPLLQLAGTETIGGVTVARVAWLANDAEGLQGLAWVAPSLGFAVVRFEATTMADSMGRRVTWRRTSSGYRPVGALWLPDRVEYTAETIRTSLESPTRLDLVATFEDYRVDTDLPAETFTPKLTIGALDARSGAFTAEPPPVPAGLAERLRQAIGASPFGPPRVETSPPDPPLGMMGGMGPMGPGMGMSMGSLGAPGRMGPAPGAAKPAPTPPPATAPPATAPATAPPAASPRNPNLVRVDQAQRRVDHARRVAANPTGDPAVLGAEARLREAIAAGDEGADPALVARRAALRAELDRAEAERRLKQATVARNEALNTKVPGTVARDEAEKGQAELAAADAEVARVRAQQAAAEVAVERPAPVELGTGPASPSTPTLQARRETQAAELARTEALLRVASIVISRNDALNKKIPGSVSREELQKAEAEYLVAKATRDREKARLAEADVALAEAKSVPVPIPAPASRPAPVVLLTRRDAQAAELARAEASLRVARIKLESTAKLVTNGSVSKAQVEMYQGEADIAQAAVDRERAKLAEADALIAEARGKGDATSAAEPTAPPPSRNLADLRDEAELLAVQMTGKQGEVAFAQATADRVNRRLAQVQVLKERNAIASLEVSEAEQASAKARADLSGRESEWRQLELRLKQTKARIEVETASLRRRVDRARDRRDWSQKMRAKGFISRESYQKDRAAYDDLMAQLDPSYQPEPDAEPDPKPDAPEAPAAAPASPRDR